MDARTILTDCLLALGCGAGFRGLLLVLDFPCNLSIILFFSHRNPPSPLASFLVGSIGTTVRAAWAGVCPDIAREASRILLAHPRLCLWVRFEPQFADQHRVERVVDLWKLLTPSVQVHTAADLPWGLAALLEIRVM